ncbi:MAG: lysine--tRNA ligase [Candidatus Thermoplasmatota archaeon]|nr:lysine--tRNA ligase [Candidatus Thermoplasmatota archaeon]
MNENIDEYELRKKKRFNLIDNNVNPYLASSERTIKIRNFLSKFRVFLDAEAEQVIAGRIRLKRTHGKITFYQVEDGSGAVQVVLAREDMGDDGYKFTQDYLDVGDIIQIRGVPFVTKKGEQSLLGKEVKILTKALRPLPDKWHGLQDEEARYRLRYLDMLMNPELREMFRKKSVFWNSIRAFLVDEGFLEVETPVLEVTPGGADANAFTTHHNALDIDLYLRISMGELWQKRLMVAGYEKTFEIGRQFRNEGLSPEHLQDYTQMEFYWAYADYQDGMKLVERMYKHCIMQTFQTLQFQIIGMNVDFDKPWITIDYIETLNKQLKIDVSKVSEVELVDKCIELDIKVEEGSNKNRIIDTLWKYCRKNINGPAFLVNHPVQVSPLAKRQPDNSELVQRFQVIIAGSELGNGYSELNDPIDQEGRFQEQAKLREQGDVEAQMHDQEFVEALEYGMPPTCGFGLSERLFSFLMDKPIKECVMFPLLRPKQTVVMEKDISNVEFNISREESFNLLNQHVKQEANINHSIETEVIMRALARELGHNEELWGAAGLLHDLDWEETGEDNADQHGIQTAEYLTHAGYPEVLVTAVKAHNFNYNDSPEPSSVLDYSLRIAETITGLIYASALVRPDKKLGSVEVKSIKKKIKDKSFAAKVDRSIIAEHEKIGLELDQFLQISLAAMQEIADDIGL